MRETLHKLALHNKEIIARVKRSVGTHKIFVIEDFKGWEYSEFLLEDIGAITAWSRGLSDEARAELDVKLLHWRNVRQWDDHWSHRFESLGQIVEIRILGESENYRVLASFISIRELVMLIGCKEQKNGSLPPKTRSEANRRLNQLRQNPNRRNEYRFD